MAWPIGTILLWDGDPAAIPVGWVACDGAGGTPPLTDRWVPAAGGAYAVAASGDGMVAGFAHGHDQGTTTVASKANNHDWALTVGSASATVPAFTAAVLSAAYDGLAHDHPPPADSTYDGFANSPPWATADSGDHAHPLTATFASATNAVYPATVALLFIVRQF